MKKFFAVLLGLFALMCLFPVAASIGDLIDGDGKTSVGVLLGLLVFFGGLATGSGTLARYLWGKTATDPVKMESKILELAARHEGRLSVADVAVAYSMPIKDARACLEHLVVQGAADLLVADGGTMVFGVRGVVGQLEKANAERV